MEAESMRDIRRARGLTQQALADKVGVHSNSLSNIERGIKKPSYDTALKIAQALGVSLGEIAFGAAETT